MRYIQFASHRLEFSPQLQLHQHLHWLQCSLQEQEVPEIHCNILHNSEGDQNEVSTSKTLLLLKIKQINLKPILEITIKQSLLIGEMNFQTKQIYAILEWSLT